MKLRQAKLLNNDVIHIETPLRVEISWNFSWNMSTTIAAIDEILCCKKSWAEQCRYCSVSYMTQLSYLFLSSLHLHTTHTTGNVDIISNYFILHQIYTKLFLQAKKNTQLFTFRMRYIAYATCPIVIGLRWRPRTPKGPKRTLNTLLLLSTC